MYVDTGNLLSYNGVPIIVVRAEDILDIAPINILNILGLDNGIDDVAIYPMPYSTVTGEGVLYCFFPTKCFIGNTEIKCMIAAIKGCSYFNKDCSALCNPSIMGG